MEHVGTYWSLLEPAGTVVDPPLLTLRCRLIVGPRVQHRLCRPLFDAICGPRAGRRGGSPPALLPTSRAFPSSPLDF
eukprot:13527413-Alexandrium_andersonii.AAC.1